MNCHALSKLWYSLLVVFSGTFLACNHFFKQDQPQKGKGIVVQNCYYAKPGKEAEVLRWRIHACNVLKEIGVRQGRVIKCLPVQRTPAGREQPDVIWIAEYPDTATRNQEVQKVLRSGKFDTVFKHMGTLIRDFQRITSEVQ